MTSMKISPETIEALKQFASINQNIRIVPGQQQETIAIAGNVFVRQQLKDTFPREVYIYDLNEFINTIKLIPNPVLDFGDSHVVVTSSDENSTAEVQYVYSEPNKVVATPDEAFEKFTNLLESGSTIEFNLSAAVLQESIRAAQAMALKYLKLAPVNGRLVLSAVDIQKPNDHSYSVDLNCPVTTDFSFIFQVEYLRVVPDDYVVTLSSNKLSRWIGQSNATEYFVALHKNSSYAG